MYKINWKKWKAAVDAAKTSEELTLLYSVRAQGRGNVHRRRAKLTHEQWSRLDVVDHDPTKPPYSIRCRGPWTTCQEPFAAAGGQLCKDLDLEHQARFVGEAYKEYLRSGTVEADVADVVVDVPVLTAKTGVA